MKLWASRCNSSYCSLREGWRADTGVGVMRILQILLLFLLGVVPVGNGHAGDPPTAAERKAWIAEMKQAPRGPFSRIRWFCEDGTVRAANQGCRGHGGGVQHGEWSERTQTLRDEGFLIANLMVEVDPQVLLVCLGVIPYNPEKDIEKLVVRREHWLSPIALDHFWNSIPHIMKLTAMNMVLLIFIAEQTEREL